MRWGLTNRLLLVVLVLGQVVLGPRVVAGLSDGAPLAPRGVAGVLVDDGHLVASERCDRAARPLVHLVVFIFGNLVVATEQPHTSPLCAP